MNPVTEAELQAWVDGRLALARRAEVEHYLAHHPQEAERLRAYRQQNAGLRALFSPVLEESIPLSMQRPRGWQRFGWQRYAWPLPRYAASVALMLASAALGWVAHGSYAGRPDVAVAGGAALPLAAAQPLSGLAHRAALAHRVFAPEVRHPVEVGADQQEHLVAWLSKRLGTPLRPPRLAPLGYELVGGRLLPGESGPVAQFMYTDASGQRLTLYVSAGQTSNRDSGFRYAQDGTLNVFYWIDGSYGYALSGALGKAELSQVANAVYAQLQP